MSTNGKVKSRRKKRNKETVEPEEEPKQNSQTKEVKEKKSKRQLMLGGTYSKLLFTQKSQKNLEAEIIDPSEKDWRKRPSAIQFFLTQNNYWSTTIAADRIEREVPVILAGLKRINIEPSRQLFIHSPYNINLTGETRLNPVAALKCQLAFAEQLGACGVVVHTGRHDKSEDYEISYGKMSKSLELVCKWLKKSKMKVRILLETTAGQGTAMSKDLEELGNIANDWKKSKLWSRHGGYCIDTAHVFVASVDLRTKKDMKIAIKTFESKLGLENIHLIHFNDSKKEHMSCVDRHALIGEGYIGKKDLGGSLGGFKVLCKWAKKKQIPMVFEFSSKTDQYPDQYLLVHKQLMKSKKSKKHKVE